MFSKYNYDPENRRQSFIEDSNGRRDGTVGVPGAGATAETRFFGQGIDIRFVVKRPKYYDRYGPFSSERICAMDRIFLEGYRREQQIWNLVYPENKADVFTEGGLRLVMPYLPGKTLTFWTNQNLNELTLYQIFLSVAFAVRRFHQLGFKYSDFNTDNVLVAQKPDGSFEAYLIDFEATHKVNEFGGSQELNALNILLPGSNWDSHYKSIDDLIAGLIEKINFNQNTNSQSFKSLP
jgi:hypothetical protein